MRTARLRKNSDELVAVASVVLRRDIPVDDMVVGTSVDTNYSRVRASSSEAAGYRHGAEPGHRTAFPKDSVGAPLGNC